MSEPHPSTWRELLGTILEKPFEKERLAAELGVKPLTLERWVTGETIPRTQNLQHLLSVLPMHRERLYDLIRAEEGMEEFSMNPPEDVSREIPRKFYAHIFRTCTSTSDFHRWWKLCDLIVKEALEQIDPNRAGMAIMIARCMTPQADNKIHTLRETFGRGTPPWPGELDRKGFFLGAESLAGHVVVTAQPASREITSAEDSVIPAQWVTGEQSAYAHPIMSSGRIAGCLLLCSTQEHHFAPEARLALIQAYANLLAIAFEPKDFYEPESLQLEMMPPHAVQKVHFADFRRRAGNAMRAVAHQGGHLDNAQADELIWRQLEGELIEVARSMSVDDQ